MLFALLLFLRLTVSYTSCNRPNILLIIADDLRPSLGCYPTFQELGNHRNKAEDYFVSPNIDQIAENGVVFTNAFAQVCPTKIGKLKRNLVCPVNVETQPLKTLPDIETTEFAIQYLRNKSVESATDTQKPFFLAVGFHKPHIPFKYPRDFKKVYPLESITIADNPFIPRNLPPVAWNPYVDIRRRDDVNALNISFPYGPLPKFYQKLVRQSYYSAVTYVDFLVGKILSTVAEYGFSNNTVIIFTSDHGWSLGEHAEWSKYSNFGVALRVPLIFSAPNLSSLEPEFKFLGPFTAQRNRRKFRYISEFVELVDLFPSLVEIAGLPSLPLCPKRILQPNSCVESDSFVPYLSAKSGRHGWTKKAIFAQYPRPSELPQLNSDQPRFQDIRIMGYTMRTKRYQYTEWVAFNGTNSKHGMKQKKVSAKELYILRVDKEQNRNVAYETRHKALINKLSKQLRRGWRSARPKVKKHKGSL